MTRKLYFKSYSKN